MELKVSVVITIKNDPKGERELMEALAGQTVKPNEVVVVRADGVDEAGNKRVYKGIYRNLKEFKGDKKIKEFKGGLKVMEVGESCSRGRGRNIGVRKARNEFIAVTDAGCRPRAEWIEKLTQCLYRDDPRWHFFDTLGSESSLTSSSPPGKNKSKVLLGSSSMISKIPSSDHLGFGKAPYSPAFLVAVAGGYRVAAKTELERVMEGFLVPRIAKINKGPAFGYKGRAFLPASRSIMFTKSAWQAVGGYPETAVSGAEDLEFARRLAAHPDVKMIYCPEAVVDWGPPESLGEFFRDIVKHTRGNMEVGYWPHLWRNLTVVLRWAAIGVWPWLGVGYLVWVMGKGIKIRGIRGIGEIWWLPVVQVAADAGVIAGLGLGIWAKLGRLGKLG